jgi:hypothetical protein
MPRVPQIQPNQIEETVTPRVKDTTRPSIEAFGGGAGEVFKAAGGLAEQAVKMKQRVIDTESKNAEFIFGRLEGEIKAGLKTRTGRNAMGSEDYVTKTWDEAMNKALEEYDDSEVKDAISAKAARKRSALQGFALQHTVDETLKYEASTQKNYKQLMKSQASTSYANPAEMKLNMAKLVASIENHGNATGKSRAEIVAETEAEVSNAHLMIGRQMVVDGQDELAEGFFNQSKKMMNTDDEAALKRLVEDSTILGFSQRKSAEYVAQGLDREASLEKARKISDPKKQEATVRKVNDRFDGMKRAKKESVENRHIEAGNFLYAEETKGNLDAYVQQNPEAWAQFSVSEKKQLETIAKQLKAGFSIKTDPKVYYNLSQMASIPKTRNKFLQENLGAPKYIGKLSESDWQEMVKLQGRLRGGRDGDPKFKGIQSRNQIMTKVLKSSGFRPASKNADDQDKIAQFYSAMEERVLDEAQRQGRDLNNTEIEDIANKMMTEVVITKSWWPDKKVKLFEAQTLQPGEESGQFRFELDDVDDIPPSSANRIANELRSQNRAATPDAILEQYQRELVEFQLDE